MASLFAGIIRNDPIGARLLPRYFEWRASKLTGSNPRRLKACQGRLADRRNGGIGRIRSLLWCRVRHPPEARMKVKTPDLPYARRKGEIEAPEIRGQISSSDGIGPVNLLSTRLISRLLLSPLIAHDALVWSMAAARLRLGRGACCRFCRRSWLRLWHALLAAMLSALILHTFKIVFFGHRDRTLFRSDGYTFARSPCELLRQPPAELMPFDTTGFRGLKDKEAPSWKDRADGASLGKSRETAFPGGGFKFDRI
jgi:hypothetical protein